ncbi:M56 family metallopeptidase [Saccharibacillus sp. CPCC 101409]|uniref:M56 family metallopeptidase n=1 Tax=Saccharibacillus sp. CPCC 101409 TaxID=3058041 RepID=UPI0026723CAD|nr:M56 family metallopeptidase [Saccharibacillus sp. CPCC 101409]MDO3410382.1 M56 family metallopeptidase [Saccharibacillus sp. CPCC 101409]
MSEAFLKLLNMSLTAGLVIVLVLLIRMPLRKAPKIFSYLLWLAVLLRLVSPVSVESAVTLLPAASADLAGRFAYAAQPDAHSSESGNESAALGGGRSDPTASLAAIESAGTNAANSPAGQAAPAAGDAAGAGVRAGAESAVDPLAAERIATLENAGGAPALGSGMSPEPAIRPWVAPAAAVWLAGAAGLLLYSIWSAASLSRRLRPSAALPGFGNKVRQTDAIAVPFVFGLIRPCIYVPVGLGKRELVYIVEHERVHIRRFDHLIKPIAFVVLCVHWFNPLVWIAFHAMSRDMELSCDEKVVRRLGSGIKKEYSSSLLALSAGREKFGVFPPSFGGGPVKERIVRILNYRKPKRPVVASAALLVAVCGALLIGDPLRDRPAAAQKLTELDYAEAYVQQRIAEFEKGPGNPDIVDSKVIRFERIAIVTGLPGEPVELWELRFRIKPDPAGSEPVTDVGTDNGWITEDFPMGKPMLMFSRSGAAPVYEGVIGSAEGDFSTPAGRETALRAHLEQEGKLTAETFPGAHILVKFPASSGETSQLLLSQPARRGAGGIWQVERWKDTQGNIYYQTPATLEEPADYFAELQAQADNGRSNDLLDPARVALDYIKSGINPGIFQNQLEIGEDEALSKFAHTPESRLLGYVSGLNGADDTFGFDQAERLTIEDRDRLKRLGVGEDELANGVYILNKYAIDTPMNVTDDTTYILLDSIDDDSGRTIDRQSFLEHLANLGVESPLSIVKTREGRVTSIESFPSLVP